MYDAYRSDFAQRREAERAVLFTPLTVDREQITWGQAFFGALGVMLFVGAFAVAMFGMGPGQ